jgi:hypothetical protein
MTIIVKSVSKKYGKDESADYDDFNDIIMSPKFNGSNGMKDINIKSIEIYDSGKIAINSLQFTYQVTTNDGASHTHVGMKYGSDGDVITPKTLTLDVDEQLTSINGKYGLDEFGDTHITYLQFQTSSRTEVYGIFNETNTAFTLPVGIFFGSEGVYVNSLGTYEIAQAIEPTVTITQKQVTTAASTVATATTTVYSPAPTGDFKSCPSNAGLSAATGILSSFMFLGVAATVFYQYRKRKVPG